MSLTLCLLVLLLERVLGSYDGKGHLCPSGSRVHWALAEKCVGRHSSSPAGWYPVCTPASIPSVYHSVAWRWLSTPVQFFIFSPLALSLSALHASLPLIIFPFLFLKRVNTHHLPFSTHLSRKCSNHWRNDKSAYELPGEGGGGALLASRKKQWIETEKQGWPQGREGWVPGLGEGRGGWTCARGDGTTMRQRRGKEAFVEQNVVIALPLAANCFGARLSQVSREWSDG